LFTKESLPNIFQKTEYPGYQFWHCNVKVHKFMLGLHKILEINLVS